jgi:hypothetical protein
LAQGERTRNRDLGPPRRVGSQELGGLQLDGGLPPDWAGHERYRCGATSAIHAVADSVRGDTPSELAK